MSLDVYLISPEIQPEESSKIFIREDGQNKEISHSEWDKRFPGQEPLVVKESSHYVFCGNITHNLSKMANMAGLYEALWRPEELDITHAHQLIDILRDGLCLLKDAPVRFKALNPENGWGNYEGLVRFVEDYLKACEENPQAQIRVSR